MSRVFVSLTVLLSVAAIACGGDKTDDSGADARAAATSTTTPKATLTPLPTSTPFISSRPSDDATEDDGGLLSALFSGGFGGLGGDFGAEGLEPGDPALKQYLLTQDDLPSGYVTLGEFSFRVPDGISDAGGADMAMNMALQGDPSEFTAFSAIMSMAIRFDDLQDLEGAFAEIDDLDAASIEDALGGFGGDGQLFSDVHQLDVSGLGDNALAISMTMNFGGLAEAFGAPEDALQGLDAMTIHMYFFARGKYAGALMRMGSGDQLSADVDELALAKTIDSRLEAAP